jgi:RNA recognition motif-containing protein
MNSKNTFLLIAVAVLGALLFSQIQLHASISFLLGVGVTAVLLMSSHAPAKEEDQAAKLSTVTLYVGNLPYKANESHVKDLFSEVGEVFAVRLMKDKKTGKRRGFGFVVMSETDANKAVSKFNDSTYMERTLKVRVANEPKGGDSSGES